VERLAKLPGVLRVYCAQLPNAPETRFWVAAWKYSAVTHPRIYWLGDAQPVVWVMSSDDRMVAADSAKAALRDAPDGYPALSGSATLEELKARIDVACVRVDTLSQVVTVLVLAPRLRAVGLAPFPDTVPLSGVPYRVAVTKW
jgi:hypothetical protein